MKVLLFCFFLLLIPTSIFAQNKSYEISGILVINGSQSLPYKLVFNEHNGKITGYSITNAKQKDETKATIEGTLDKYKKQINFKETSILGSRPKNDTDIMCMVNVSLIYKSAKQTVVFNGKFIGKDLKSGKECAKGTISMISYISLPNLFENDDKKDTVLQTITKLSEQKTAPAKTDSFSAIDEITKGIEIVYDWRSDTVILDLWDGGKVDNDLVSLIFNTDTVLKHYVLKAEKLRLKIALSKNHDIDKLFILAENEGAEPPNTANLTLIDETKKYNVIAYNEIGKLATINLKHKHQK